MMETDWETIDLQVVINLMENGYLLGEECTSGKSL